MQKIEETKQPAIAVVGSGYWGKNLVRNYYELGALKLVCDKNDTLLANVKESYPNVETCYALNDVLRRQDIDAIVIATPAETHFGIAREGLIAGKHIFVEKPLVLDENEGEALIKLAEDRNLVLMVGHLLQYHPAFMKLKEMVSQGELGRVNYIYSNRLNLGKIRREENILWSFAPHDISMIMALAGEEPESISATGGYYLHNKIADVTTTHLAFPSGLQAHIFVSWLHPFKEQKLVVVGNQKMAVFDDTQPWQDKLRIYPHHIDWHNSLPVPRKADALSVDVPQDEPLKCECRHFMECIRNKTVPRTDGHEGVRVLRILNASQRSLDGHNCKIDFRDYKAAQRKKDDAQAAYFAHSSAAIDDGCAIGRGTKIWHFSHVLPGSQIGENCNIGQNVVIGPDVSIGKNCKIQNNVSVYKGVTLEDDVFCGPSIVFTNIYNPRAEIRKMDQIRPTFVKRGATLGANSTIVCGVTIGRYAFIGAGSVVTKNVPDHALIVGNPGRQIGWACECGERLTEDLDCLTCGKQHQKTEQGLRILQV